MQYGVKLPSRVAIVGQTDSGKTHSIIRRWLGGKTSFWKHDVNGELKACQLQTVCIVVMGEFPMMKEND